MLVHVLQEYNVNKILLSYLGLWPLQNKFIRNLLPISYLVLHISLLLLEILTLYNHWENMQLAFEIFHYIVSSMIFIVKLVNEFLNYDKVIYLYKAMENHWNIFTSEFEMRILKDYSILSRKFTIIYAITLYNMLILYLMASLQPILFDIIWPLNESRPRFLAMYIDWRIDKDKYFVPLFCYNTITIVTGIVILVGTETIYITRIIHACSLFSIISQQFKKIMSKADTNMKVSKRECYINGMNVSFKLTSEQVIYKEYIICLKKYQLALEFVDVLNSMYRLVALLSLVYAVAVISLAAIEVVYMLDQFGQLLKRVLVVIGSIIELIMLCYPSQKLLDESQNVFYKIYAVEWYTFSPRLKSLIIITLHRSFTPCSLIAGNICSLSMSTLASVLRAGISYFTTFLSLKD